MMMKKSTISITKTLGFTLVEIMVVVSIISVLVSVTLISLNGVRANSRDAKRFNDLKQVEVALELYRQTNNQYPNTNGLWQTVCKYGADPVPRDVTGPAGYIPNLAPDFIRELPIDPSGCVRKGAFGGYIYVSNGTEYKFSADWTSESGLACKSGKRLWDPLRGEGGMARTSGERREFCSVYTPGAALW